MTGILKLMSILVLACLTFSASAQAAGQVLFDTGHREPFRIDAAGELQRAGYISSRRGHIAVLNRDGLEAAACECYRVVRKEILRIQAGTCH